MSIQEIEDGKRWVVAKLLEIAYESNLLVTKDDCIWKEQNSDFSLIVEFLGVRYKEIFIEELLEDSMSDEMVKAALERQIRNFIKTLGKK